MKQSISSSWPTEIWKPIVGWEGLYSVSNLGQVRTDARVIHYSDGRVQRRKPRPRSLGDHVFGYKTVTLKAKGRRQETPTVHRLVMEAFVGPRPDGMNVCHNNGDPTDNRLGNLRYDTQSENMSDRRRHGTDHEVNKTHCPRGHLLAGANLVPSKLAHGSRECLSCARAYGRVYYMPMLRPNFQKIADEVYMSLDMHAIS